MGMESYGGESRPDVLNSLWPEGRDSLKYGDNHLRLVKTVVKNFYSDFNSFKTKIEGYFDSSGNAKKALDSDKLGEQDPSYYLDGANATGTLSGTKVSPSTTSQRGTVQLYNGVDSSSTSYASTANATKQAYDRATQALSKANQGVSLGGAQYTGYNDDLTLHNAYTTGKIPTESVVVGAKTGHSWAQRWRYRRVL